MSRIRGPESSASTDPKWATYSSLIGGSTLWRSPKSSPKSFWRPKMPFVNLVFGLVFGTALAVSKVVSKVVLEMNRRHHLGAVNRRKYSLNSSPKTVDTPKNRVITRVITRVVMRSYA